MTVAAELVKRNQRLEYFIAISGVGWMTDETDLSSGFDGAVFATNDLDGDLATVLGCTVYDGLSLPSGISERIDPRTGDYSVGGLSFKILDTYDYWLQNMTPRKTGNNSELVNAAEYVDDTIRVLDGTQYDNGEVIWIGGREAVLLAGKAAVGVGNQYDYDVTRGYLGTPAGSALRRLEDYLWRLWPAGAPVSDIGKVWFNRRIHLWAHVPGEAVENCLLLWSGKLRSAQNDSAGVEWSFSGTGDFLEDVGRIWRPTEWWVKMDRTFMQPGAGGNLGSPAADGYHYSGQAYGSIRYMELGELSTEETGLEQNGKYSMANWYHWRAEPGGYAGLVSEWDAGTVQAVDLSIDNDMIGEFIQVGDEILYAIARYDDNGATDPRRIRAEIISSAGTSPIDPDDQYGGLVKLHETGARCRFLLSNWDNRHHTNRFSVNNNVTKNIIDQLLIFMTSSDVEYWRATSTGGAGTVINFAAGAVGSVNRWAGKTLFCVDGVNNKWYSRTIVSNTANNITVERAFPGAYQAVEYQIRSSQYDVLPIGWGMGIDPDHIDIAAFELMRERYFQTTDVADFIIGSEDEIDIWELIRNNICRPYGILIYFDRDTRKISCKYIGHAIGDGIVDDYVAINEHHIVDTGSLDMQFANPVGCIRLEVRDVAQRIVNAAQSVSPTGQNTDYATARMIEKKVSSAIGGQTQKIIIKAKDVESSFSESGADEISLTALFNTRDNMSDVTGRLVGMMRQYSSPPPVWSGVKLDMELYPQLHPGSWVVITWNDPAAPANPFTGERGWVDVVGRVVEMNLSLGSEPTFTASFELFQTIAGRKLASAAVVTGKWSDGVGGSIDYFTVEDTNFVADPDNDKDWWYFAVGDRLELRDKYGALQAGGVFTIHSFGTNEATNPEDANSSRINVNENLAAVALSADDYLTFAPSSASNTTNMDKHSAYGDAAGDVTDSFTRYYP